MLRYTNQKTIATVKRLVYSGSPSKGTQQTVYTNLTGYLRPLSEESAAVSQMQWGVAFNLITEIDSPILVGDVLVIDSATYTVKGFADHSRGGLNTGYFKYLLTQQQKQ